LAEEKTGDFSLRDSYGNKSDKRVLIFSHFEVYYFSRFAFRKNFKWPATDFAIRRELLRFNAGVDDQFKPLAAERALNTFGNLHRQSLVHRRVLPNQFGKSLEPRALRNYFGSLNVP
jgi:hypothetical protein